jgi:cysteine-S-conjugate beta-lyase
MSMPVIATNIDSNRIEEYDTSKSLKVGGLVMEWETRLIHSGYDTCEHTGAVSVPIYHASTYKQSSMDKENAYFYGRYGNPTREALEGLMAVLEGGSHGFAFSSGMAAISSALSLLEAGQHIIAGRDIYGGTYKALTTLFSRFGISHSFVDMSDVQAIKEAILPNTKALFLETPSNPLMRITDLRACKELAEKHGLLTIVDNTFMSPYLQRPLELGMDVVVHSATKFLGGHSDTIAGVAVVREEELAGRMRDIQRTFGAVLNPFDCWLVMRGIRTLRVRMDAQQETAGKLAAWLNGHPQVNKVYYPGLEGMPGNETHFSQCDGPGCVFSFKLQSESAAKRLLESVRLAVPAVSLGGVESILSYPARMSHSSMPKALRDELGISESLVRMSVGLEAFKDLKEDLERALTTKK